MKNQILLPALLFMFCFAGRITAQEVKINHDGTDGFAIEADGTIRADGAATTWDDLKVPFSSSTKGNSVDISFDETNMALGFPLSADGSKAIFLAVQMPHKYKEGSKIYPHIHWQQSSTTAVEWKMEYKWFNNNELIPAAITSATDSIEKFTYPGTHTDGDKLAQISSFPVIHGIAGQYNATTNPGVTDTEKKISSLLLIKLWLNSGPSTVYAFEFDIHFQIDTQGSRDDFTK